MEIVKKNIAEIDVGDVLIKKRFNERCEVKDVLYETKNRKNDTKYLYFFGFVVNEKGLYHMFQSEYGRFKVVQVTE